MRKIAIAGMFGAALALASCIFQNDPVGPNLPPSIQDYTPKVTFFSLTAPDSCSFLIRAVDPDGDEIRYSFVLGDSLLGERDSVTFYARCAGVYRIRGEVRDGTAKVFHDWQVTVVERDDAPPKITWSVPEQAQVACAVGDTLEFHIQASDDHPETLAYSYLLNSTLLHAGSPDLINRFMERGEFLLEGVAWDGQNGDTVSWNVTVEGYPDTLAPAAILDLTGGPGDVNGTIALEWTAPGDDGSDGKAASYVVRTSTYPILTEDDWKDAEGKVGEPVPSIAGSRERMSIRNLVTASYVYVTMRAVDDFFNVSPLGNCIKVLVRGIDIGGRAINAATGEPVAGIVVLTSIRADTTDAAGNYLLENVPAFTTSVTARDENIYGDKGSYYDLQLPITNGVQYVERNLFMIPVFGLLNVVEPNMYEDRFLMFFKDITKTSGDQGVTTVFKGWNHWPVTVFNPPKVYQDVDLQAAASIAMADWEQVTGCDLFIETGQSEGADALIIYDDTLKYSHHVITTALNDDGTPRTRELLIYTRNTAVPIASYAQLVFAHELGHVLGLNHSRNVGHLLVGLTMPQVHHPTVDEARVMQVLYYSPNIYNYKNVIEE